MGAEDGMGPGRHLGQLLDETRTHPLQPLDDMAVVDDLMAYIDGGSIDREGPLDDIDGTNDTGTKTAGLGQNHLHELHLDPIPTNSHPRGAR